MTPPIPGLQEILNSVHDLPRLAVFHRFGICFDIHASNPALAQQWAFALEPYFTPLAMPTAGGTVTVFLRAVDAVSWAGIRAYIESRPASQLPGFLGLRADSIRLVELPGGLQAVTNDRRDVLYIRHRSHAAVLTILYAEGAEAAGQFALINLILSFTSYRADRSGLVPFHAAAVNLHGAGVLIAGDRFAGKTTTLISLLAHSPADFVANDQVGVDRQFMLHGWPNVAAVRLGSIRFSDQLDQYVRALARSPAPPHRALFHNADAVELYARLAPDQLARSGVRIRFSPRELAGVTGRQVTSAAPLRLILLPSHDERVVRTGFSQVTVAGAREALRGQLLRQTFHDPWAAYPASPEYWEERVEQIARSVPVMTVRHNANTLVETARTVRGLLR